ncbi:MAG: DNA recombination protein RmuC [Burkholderiales bacterium]|nr:DNA recombination protein RmuC [Burkholderiales bacterium]
MTLIEGLLILLVAGVLAMVVLLAVGLARRPRAARDTLQQIAQAQQQSADHMTREIRTEVLEQARGNRAEMSESVSRFANQLTEQLRSMSGLQHAQIDAFSQQLARLTESNERRLHEIREALEARLLALQTDNAAKLEQMRQTVDEKLHATLEQRLGESFKLVSDRLEQVHRGLGEMRALASDVGDLKRVLSNVKTRGIWGEVQLGRADAKGVEDAGRALEQRLRLEARRIREKYIDPPHTTDFALLFLPTEGLYAEVVRRAGLVDELQRQHRVVLAGPTTLAALLNSLQMGFRTLAVERRTSEVWSVLGAVKTEFGKFGDVLAKTRQQLQTVTHSLDSAEVRSRAIVRKLKDVEALPETQARELLTREGDTQETP